MPIKSRVRAIANSLPAGTIPIGLGLFVNGIVTFIFLKLAAVAIPDNHERYLTTMWFLTFTLAPGVLMPLEQELGRAISSRRHFGQGSRPVIQKASVLGAAIIGVLVFLALAFSPLYINAAFAGSTAMLAVFALSLPTYGAYYLMRGVFAGSHSFNAYGWLLAAEGILRVVLCFFLLGAGVKHESYFAATLVVAPIITIVVLALREREIVNDGPGAKWSELTNALGLLIAGQLFAQFLMNAAPLAVSFMTHEASATNKAVATRYSYGFLLARVPLYLFAAVQAALLPKLAHLIAAGKVDEFRHGMKKLYIVIAGVTVTFMIGAGLFGPTVITRLYGEDYRLSRQTFMLLALASGAFMFATAFAQGLIAISRYRDVATSWIIGAIVFVISLRFANEVQLRANLGFLFGSTAAAISSAFILSNRITRYRPIKPRDFDHLNPELVVEP